MTIESHVPTQKRNLGPDVSLTLTMVRQRHMQYIGQHCRLDIDGVEGARAFVSA